MDMANRCTLLKLKARGQDRKACESAKEKVKLDEIEKCAKEATALGDSLSGDFTIRFN